MVWRFLKASVIFPVLRRSIIVISGCGRSCVFCLVMMVGVFVLSKEEVLLNKVIVGH